MSEITLQKSTIPQHDLEIECHVATATATIIVNNNGIYDSIE